MDTLLSEIEADLSMAEDASVDCGLVKREQPFNPNAPQPRFAHSMRRASTLATAYGVWLGVGQSARVAVRQGVMLALSG